MTLYGDSYSTLWVNANGWVSVLENADGYHLPPSTNPSIDFPNGYIAPLWADWCASITGCVGAVNTGVGVYYEIDATPGAGRITIEWRNVRHFADDQLASDVDFSLTLYEGARSTIELRYGEARPGLNMAGSFTNFMARIGIERASPSEGMFLGPCPAASPCTTAQVQSLRDTKITILADLGADLTVSSVSAAPTGTAGLPLSVDVRLTSRHGMPIGPFVYQAQLLGPSATSTVGAPVLFVSPPTALAAFESRVDRFAIELPASLADGAYRVAVTVDADDRIAEIEEADNVAFGADTVTIAGRGPDLRAVRLRPLRTQVTAGDALPVTYTVDDYGNEPATFSLQLVLSDNPTISTSDRALGPPQTLTLAPRETISATVTVALPDPIRSGRYWLGALLDPELAVAELDEGNNTRRASEAIVVHSSQVAILTPELAAISLGAPYDVRWEAVGGDGSFQWSIVSGSLPPGMTSSGDRLSGVALAVGAFPFTVRAASAGASAERDYELVVLDPDYPLTFLSRGLPTAVLGADYGVVLRAAGGRPPYRFRRIDGRLPDGLALALDGTIAGTPSASGVGVFTVELRDDGTATATATLSLEVRSPGNLSILTSALPDATLGEPYTQSLFVSGGAPPIRWRALTATPPGIVVAPEGAVNGIPETVGSHRILVEAVDTTGKMDTALLEFEVRSDGLFRIVTTNVPAAVVREPYEVSIEANGGSRPFECGVLRSEGFLPPGIDATQRDGEEETNTLFLRGVPERAGRWPFTVSCTDRNRREAQAVFLLEVEAPVVAEEPAGCGCSATSTRSSEWWIVGLVLGAAMRRKSFR